jgi:hypothetical protein
MRRKTRSVVHAKDLLIVQQVGEMLTLLAGRGGLLKDKFKVREGKAQDALVI